MGWLERPERKLWRTFLTHHRRRPLLLAPLSNRFGRRLFSLGIRRCRKIALLILLRDRLGSITSHVIRGIMSWRKRRLGHGIG